MKPQRPIQQLDDPEAYPLVRNYLGYGLGLTSPYECREVLNPSTRLTSLDGVWEEGVEAMVAYIEQTFSRPSEPLRRLNGECLQTYMRTLEEWCREQGISVQEACEMMARAMPRDWTASEQGHNGRS